MVAREFYSHVQASISDVMYRVYGWMGVGLAITAITAFAVSSSPSLIQAIYANNVIIFALMLAQLALVVALSFFLTRLSYPVAALLFLLYSCLTGVTLSSIFLIFTQSSIFATFLIASAMFIAMSVYGYLTRADLTTLGNLLFMVLIGLIVAMLINLFLKSSRFEMVISGIGVLLFTLLIAVDTQKIKLIAQQLMAQQESISKIALVGALTLYLDFLNLFLFLLSFTGQRRQE